MRQEAETRARVERACRAPARASDGPARDDATASASSLQANIERSDDVAAALAAGAEGIGLYRSEFMLVGGPPDMAAEDEQYHVYRAAGGADGAAAGDDSHVRHRRAAAGAAARRRGARRALVSRITSAAGHAGLRGIRFGLAQPAIFKTQLRALLRAAAHGPLRDHVSVRVVAARSARGAGRCWPRRARSCRRAASTTPAVPVGIMIEVPSAAFTASLLAREVDFFTIGTNDLIQYTLAVDRTDERVSNRYEPLHPAVLRLLRQVRRGAVRRGIPVSVCGEMASDPLLLRLLIGCGLTEFSMTPGALPMARRVVAGDERRRHGADRRARADARHGRGDRAVPARRVRPSPAMRDER